MALNPDRIRLEDGARPLEGYQLVKRIGHGGFGEVWQAQGPGDIPCAMKFVLLDLEDPDQVKKAKMEVRSLDVMKDIDHPHLVRLFGAWQKDGFLVVAMELGEQTLKQRLAEATATGASGIPAEELRKYMVEAAEGLDFLNLKSQIQHRDVKPENLLLKGGSLLVADFGLAKVLEHTQTSHTGALSVLYAAPEFFMGEATRWSDQYSLAVTYCHLRGNRLPFVGKAPQVMKGHMELAPDLTMLPAEERAAVTRALAKDPKERWPNCRSFIEALPSPIRPAEPLTEKIVLPLPVVVAPLSEDLFADSQFVRLPPGSFWMGGRGGWPGEEQVAIEREFFLGIYPVTQEQWQAVMGNNPSWFSRKGGGKDRVKEISEADLKQFPVEQVSWQDIQEYLAKLNQQKADSEWLYRLPTEEEWEYTCREGATSKKDCSFDFYVGATPTNDLSSTDANFNGNTPAGQARKGQNLGRTSKVGSYTPNRLGLYDMHGNVWEWCSDALGSVRVNRGGSWYWCGSDCSAAYRRRDAPGYSDFRLGFRLARVRPGL